MGKKKRVNPVRYILHTQCILRTYRYTVLDVYHGSGSVQESIIWDLVLVRLFIIIYSGHSRKGSLTVYGPPGQYSGITILMITFPACVKRSDESFNLHTTKKYKDT